MFMPGPNIMYYRHELKQISSVHETGWWENKSP